MNGRLQGNQLVVFDEWDKIHVIVTLDDENSDTERDSTNGRIAPKQDRMNRQRHAPIRVVFDALRAE